MAGSKHEYDSVFLNSRRETVVLLIAFSFFLVWSVGVSYLTGYGVHPADLGDTVLGMPRWVFWGVCIPWCGSIAFTFWFAGFCIADDPLEAPSPHDGDEEGDS